MSAIENTKFGRKVHYKMSEPHKIPKVKLYDQSVLNIDCNKMAQIANKIVLMAEKYSHTISIKTELSMGRSSIIFANSSGVTLNSKSTYFGVLACGQLVSPENIVQIYAGLEQARLDMRYDKLIKKIAVLSEMANKTVKIRSGIISVILLPEAMKILINPLKNALSGKNKLLGFSPLSMSLGKKIANKAFNLTDNPLVDWAVASSCFDDEGVPRRVTPLIRNGVLKNFLYDLESSVRVGKTSTGHGPDCQCTNLIIHNGSTPYKNMIKSLKEGLIVHTVIGAEQNNNIDGDFSVNVGLGFKIEDGKIVGRVKNIMLSGNVYEVLGNIEDIGDKANWVWGENLLTPPVLIKTLNLIAKEN